MIEVFPFRPGDWVSDDHDRIAKVKGVWELQGAVLLDLIIYNRDGKRLGRTSPACGGPRGYEPACSAEGWQRIAEPDFPIRLKWVDNGQGGSVARMWAGERLPPANWKKPAPRKRKPRLFRDGPTDADILRRALQRIADGHNDPRALAEAVLKVCRS